jgi:hypothetical protein
VVGTVIDEGKSLVSLPRLERPALRLMSRKRWLPMAVLPLLIAGLLAACTPSRGPVTPISVGELVGTWRGQAGAWMRLERDHSLIAHQVPLQLYDPDFHSEAWTGQGTWDLDSSDSYGKLTIGKGEWGDTLDVSKRRGNWLILFYIGDPDEGNRYIFHK